MCTKFLGYTKMLFDNLSSHLPKSYKSRESLIIKFFGSRIIDVLFHIPSYATEKIFSFPIKISDAEKIIYTKFTPICFEKKTYSKKNVFKVYGQSLDVSLELVFFNLNPRYIKNKLFIGKEVYICGKLTYSPFDGYKISQPEIFSNSSYINTSGIISNTYPLTTGITQNTVYYLQKYCCNLLNNFKIQEWLPKNIIDLFNFPSFKESFLSIHFPKKVSDVKLSEKYLQRLAFDEILSEQIALKITNEKDSLNGCLIKNDKTLAKKLIDTISFELTTDQKKALENIYKDISSGKRMTRLLQGDVGSGKTIVALISALYAIESGYQVAFLAPTEILARQHYLSWQKYLENTNIQIAILTSFEKTKYRKILSDQLLSGVVNILVGTHAIITDKVLFHNLGLVIVDEQHRFGVNQRLSLIEKGKNPHVLSMTATPIPRTIILSTYGDISLSLIKTKPIGRKKIITSAMPASKINTLTDSLKRIIEKQQKVYWVCPIIEQSEKLNYSCVVNRFEFLKKHFGNEVSMMHGKMNSEEKDEIFHKFKSGESKILVSTTIIEVGVDVRDAVVIVIENAEKFGLSQLHQLRGRVGRSELQSFCILLYEDKISEIQKKRIEIIRESDDGFFIADKDLVLRGEGEILGLKQSGSKKYKTFDLCDSENEEIIQNMLKTASELASSIVLEKKTKNYEFIMKIFQNENFENIKKSF